jgi:hypothetical protein
MRQKTPKRYRCPVCNKPLTKSEFERAFKVHEAQKEHIEAERRALDEQKVKLRDEKARLKNDKKRIKSEVRLAERARTRRLLHGKDKVIVALRQRVKQAMRGKTPQEEGPEFELKLVKRLREEFSSDHIEHRGKGCDVYHVVKDGKNEAGLIIYECKWTPAIHESHVR